MGKFKIHLKVQGLELDVEGDRPDIVEINNAVSREFAGLIQPAAALMGGTDSPTPPVIDAEISNGKKARSPRRRSGGSHSSSESEAQAIDFRHDPEKYGNPTQAWKVAEKAIWLLYVLKDSQSTSEASAAQLVATFNKHFKQAKTIYVRHVSRDLGQAKIQNPSLVGENNGLWYLTNEGDRQAQQLIQGVMSPAA